MNDDDVNYFDPKTQAYLLLICLRELYPATAARVLNKAFQGYEHDTLAVLQKLVLSDPLLYRLVLTTYFEPVEDWSLRLKLWCIPTVFGINADQLTAFIIQDEYYIKAAWVYYYESLTKKHESLNHFFLNFYSDFAVALRADMQKFMGREGTISELRNKQFQVIEYEDDDEKVIDVTGRRIDNWPNANIKELKKRKRTKEGKKVTEYEVHVHLLKDSVGQWEYGADNHLIHYWHAWADFSEKQAAFGGTFKDKDIIKPYFAGPKVTVFIYSKEGNLVKEYPFSLIPKYTPKIQKVMRQLKGQEERLAPYHPFDLSLEEVESKFFELAIKYNPDEHGFFAGYIDARLFKALRDSREKGILRTDIEYHPDRLDELIDDNDKDKGSKLDFLWQDSGDTPPGIYAPLSTSALEMASSVTRVLIKEAFDKWLLSDTCKKILEHYKAGCKTQAEVAEKMGISQQAISEHLKKLKQALLK